MKMISVVVPAFNEETVLDEFYRRCTGVFANTAYGYELIFVDDGSTDGTLARLKEYSTLDQNVKILSFSRNFGHQIAITAGMDHAAGDAIVIIDADLQDPPELIPEMINEWEQGYEVVYAKRKKREGESLFKRLTAYTFYRVINAMTATDIPVDTGDFRLIDRAVADSLKTLREKNRFVRGLVSWVGFKQTAVEFERQERFSGETKYPLTKMIRMALNGIFSFSDKPLKIASVMGIVSSVVGFLMILWGFYSKFFMAETTIKGWTSVFVAVLFLGGVQLLTIGIIGEYIGRLYDEVKNRPLYIVKENVNFEKMP